MRLSRTRLIGQATLVGVVFIVLGTGWREDRYSCHLCRGLKERQTTTWLNWCLGSQETISQFGAASVPHAHDWWRYSYFVSSGPGGCLGKSVTCHTDGRYKDEQLEVVR